MLRNIAVAFTLVFLLPVLVLAQDGKLRGKVSDKESGDPLIGANVVVEGANLGASTDVNGEYVVLSVPPGVYTVKASYIGYSAYTINNVRVGSNITITQDFSLSSTAVQAQEVVITAERPLVQRNTTNTYRINTQENIQTIPFRGINNILAMEAGVVLQNGNLYVRGGRAGEVAFFIDGANTTNPMTNTNNVAVIQEALEEIQLQSGGFTAEFGGANSGIVRSQIRTGGPDFKASVEYQTDDFAKPGEKFAGTSSFGFRNAVATISGAIPGMSDLRFFVAGAHDYVRNRQQIFMQPFSFSGLVTDNLGSRPAGTPLPGTVEFKENYLYNNWDQTNSVQGTATFDMLPFKLRFTGTYSFNDRPTDNTWPGVLAGYFNQGRSRTDETQTVFGNLRLTHILNSTTSYDLGVSYQKRSFRRFDPAFGDDWKLYADSAANAEKGFTGFVSHWQGPLPYSTIYQFTFDDPNAPSNSYLKESQSDIGANIDFTSQVNSRWELKAGGRIDSWTMRSYSQVAISSLMTYLYGTDGQQTRSFATDYERRVRIIQSSATIMGYDVDGNEVDDGFDKPGRPIEVSAYLQNKFEYNDLVLNVGVRYEYRAPHGNRLPTALYDNPPVDQSLNIVDETAFVEQDPFSLLLPRLNFSFPVTVGTVFYAQFGKFAQFPSLNNYYHGNIDISGRVNPSTRNPYTLAPGGSPAFETRPERTTQYTVGIRQALSDNFAFDVSGFYKDNQDQLTLRRITNDQGVPLFVGWSNSDFGITKGVEITMDLRRTNRLSAKVNYTLSDARGTGSDALSSRQAVTDDATARFPAFINPLEFNQTHRGSVMLDYRWGKGDGGPVLEGLGVNLLFTFNSGHNYTKVEENSNLGQSSAWLLGSYYLGDSRFRNPNEPVNSSTTPWVFNLDLNLGKTFFLGGLNVEVFLNVLNVLNTKNVINVYPRTGTASDDGFLKTSAADTYKPTPNFEAFYRAINNDNRWAYMNRTGNDLYSSPRQARLGLKFEM